MSVAAGQPTHSPRAYAFDAAYATVPNWDIGRPQRAFVYLEEEGLVRDPVLDVGCGTGELSLFLARREHDVLGIDIAPRAIEQARTKARWRRIPAAFLAWNALDLAGLADTGLVFETAVDSGLFHLLGDADRDRYIAGLASSNPVVPSSSSGTQGPILARSTASRPANSATGSGARRAGTSRSSHRASSSGDTAGNRPTSPV